MKPLFFHRLRFCLGNYSNVFKTNIVKKRTQFLHTRGFTPCTKNRYLKNDANDKIYT